MAGTRSPPRSVVIRRVRGGRDSNAPGVIKNGNTVTAITEITWVDPPSTDNRRAGDYNARVGMEAIQQTLRNLAKAGTLVQRCDRWQLWHFAHEGRPYLLRFHPTSGKSLLRPPSAAMREFTSLQVLQRASVPAPRAIAVLMGFVLDGVRGDAIIYESIEPSMPLDRSLNDRELAAEAVPRHLDLARQFRTLIHGLGRAKLRHPGLRAQSFLLSGERLYLKDGTGLRPGGLRLADIRRLGHAMRRWATAGDLQRTWELLGSGEAMPAVNPASRRLYQRFVSSSIDENESFGRLRYASAENGRWRGHYFKRIEHPYRWSAASRLMIREADWLAAWPILFGQILSDQLGVLKRDESGDVLEGEVVLSGRPVAVIIKRPRRKYWWRHINEIGRGVRARRAWVKGWQLIARDIPTAWPLLVMERRTLGHTTDALIVMEKVEGPTLASIDLNQMNRRDRQTLFHRAGAILRRMESTGLYHWDSKSTNWIIRMDEKRGPSPLLVDVDGIRRIRWTRSGIGRLLRAMKQHPQFTAEDSQSLCRGYAPWATTYGRS